MFLSGYFSISRSNQMGWYWSSWSSTGSLRGKSCAFVLCTAPAGSVPCGPLRLAFMRTWCKIRIKSSGKNPCKEVSHICSSSSSAKTKTFHAIMCWCSGTALCVGMETDIRFLAPVRLDFVLCPTLLILGWKWEFLLSKT